MKQLLLAILLVLSNFWLFAIAEDVVAEKKENYLMHAKQIEWEAGGFYEGEFADGTPFQMDLPYPTPKSILREDWGTNTLGGAYWYPRKYSGDRISLRVLSFTGDSFLIAADASDEKGKLVTEERFEGTLSRDRREVLGIWKQERYKKQLAFTMRRVFLYKGVDVSFPNEVERNLRSLGDVDPEELAVIPERPFIYSAVFPVIGNSKVDAWIRDLVSNCDFDLECTNEVTIAWFSGSMLSLHGSVWGYGYGAAHGTGYTVYRHFVTDLKSPTTVALDYFVSVSPKCLETVSKRIVSSLEKVEVSNPGNGFITNWREARFLPTPVGILFAFDPYEVGAYAEGAPSIFVERRYLEKCLKYLPSYVRPRYGF